MKKTRMVALLLMLVMLCTSVFSAGIGVNAEGNDKPVENFQYSDYKNFINYRSPLINTYNRLTTDKELTVVYFGGSVTAGYGSTDNGSWRSKVEQWFDDTFTDASITHINTAIGESGTFLGTYRVQSDVIAKSPDLIFIEYAINDYYKGSNKKTAALQYETIVREIRTALPKCDIVTILTTDSSVVGTLYPSAAGHEEMAINYDISSINVGASLWDEIGKTKENWDTYFTDIVHPTNEGYGLYYKCIEEYLKNALLCTDFTGIETPSKELGPVYSEHLLDGNRVAAMGDGLAEYVDADETSGFTYVSGEYFAGSDGALHTGYYQATGTDAKITFKFSGTEFALWTNFKAKSKINYSIDGGETQDLTCHAHAPTQIITGLSAGDHTITVAPVSYGDLTEMNIHAIFTRDETVQTLQTKVGDAVEFDFGDLAGIAGDVDVDTYITSADLAQLKKILLGSIIAQSEKTADANGDEKVNIVDLVNLKKTLVNKEKAYFDEGITTVCGDESDKTTYMYSMNASGLNVREAEIDLGTDGGNELVITQLSDFHLIAMNEEDKADSVLVQSYESRKNSFSNQLRNAQNAMEFANFYDKTVVTGDVTDYLSIGSLDLFKSIVGETNTLAAVGNHEFRKVWFDPWTDGSPEAERYATLQENWPYNNIFYHSEIMKNKVMLIVMNNGADSDTYQQYYAGEFTSKDALGNEMTGTMDEFLAKDITTAKENGYAVLIFQHCPISSGDVADKSLKSIDNKYSGKEELNGSADLYTKYVGGDGIDNSAVDTAVYELITENANVIKGLFCGHVHGHFYNEVLAKSTPESAEKDTFIPQYMLTCNAYESGSALKITVKY